jgi:N-acetylneuraminic acid mutarotase
MELLRADSLVLVGLLTPAIESSALANARFSFRMSKVQQLRIAILAASVALLSTLILPMVVGATGNGWTTVAPMPTARDDVAAATGSDGRIYVVGGSAGSYALQTSEVYTPSTNTWTSIASMSTDRQYPAAAAGPDGRIYVFGGAGIQGFLKTAEAYNPTTNAWSPVTPMSTARWVPAAATGSDGRIYVFGGYNSGLYLNTAESYSPGTNTWTPIAPMSTARVGAAAATGRDGRIYVFGGTPDGNPKFLNTAEVYNPGTNTWASLPTMSTSRVDVAAATGPDGRLYLFGGYNSGGAPALDTAEAYSPTANAWTPIASMPTPRAQFAAAAGQDGHIFLFGGRNGNGPLNTTDSYTAVIDTTPPTVSCSVTPSTLWPPNGKLATVQVTVSVTDPDGSGPNGFKLVAITSNEGNIATQQQGFVVGTSSTNGKLRAARNDEKETGRVYTLTYQGSDMAGNTATCAVKVRVPLDKDG